MSFASSRSKNVSLARIRVYKSFVKERGRERERERHEISLTSSREVIVNKGLNKIGPKIS